MSFFKSPKEGKKEIEEIEMENLSVSPIQDKRLMWRQTIEENEQRLNELDEKIQFLLEERLANIEGLLNLDSKNSIWKKEEDIYERMINILGCDTFADNELTQQVNQYIEILKLAQKNPMPSEDLLILAENFHNNLLEQHKSEAEAEAENLLATLKYIHIKLFILNRLTRSSATVLKL